MDSQNSKEKKAPLRKPLTTNVRQRSKSETNKISSSKTSTLSSNVRKTPLKRCATDPSPNKKLVPPGAKKPQLGSAKKPQLGSAKKQSWKRRPLPAHSGVPVPEKMRKLQMKLLLEEAKRNDAATTETVT